MKTAVGPAAAEVARSPTSAAGGAALRSSRGLRLWGTAGSPLPSAPAPASTAGALVAADPRPRGGGTKLRDLVLLAAAVAAHVGDGARGVGRRVRCGGFGDGRLGDGSSRRRVFVLVGVVRPVRRVVVDVLEVVHLVVGEYVADGVVLGGFLVVGRVGGCLVGFLGEGLFPAHASAAVVRFGLDALAVDLGGLRRGVRGERIALVLVVLPIFPVALAVVVVVVVVVAARIFGDALQVIGIRPRLVLLSRVFIAALVRQLCEKERKMLAERLVAEIVVAVSVPRAHEPLRDRLLREHALREGELAPGQERGDDAENLRVRVPRHQEPRLGKRCRRHRARSPPRRSRLPGRSERRSNFERPKKTRSTFGVSRTRFSFRSHAAALWRRAERRVVTCDPVSGVGIDVVAERRQASACAVDRAGQKG